MGLRMLLLLVQARLGSFPFGSGKYQSERLVSLSNGSVSGVSRIPKHSRPAASGTGL